MLMENIREFQRWLDDCSRDAKAKLGLTDREIYFSLIKKAYIPRTEVTCMGCYHFPVCGKFANGKKDEAVADIERYSKKEAEGCDFYS